MSCNKVKTLLTECTYYRDKDGSAYFFLCKIKITIQIFVLGIPLERGIGLSA